MNAITKFSRLKKPITKNGLDLSSRSTRTKQSNGKHSKFMPGSNHFSLLWIDSIQYRLIEAADAWIISICIKEMINHPFIKENYFNTNILKKNIWINAFTFNWVVALNSVVVLTANILNFFGKPWDPKIINEKGCIQCYYYHFETKIEVLISRIQHFILISGI